MGIISIILLLIPLILFIGALKDGWAVFSKIGLLQKVFQSGAKRFELQSYLINFSYYQALSEKGKKRFFDRVQTFIFCKEFIGKNDLTITEEIKVLISASAVQLTFGLKYFKLENIETIYVYPESFYGGNHNQHFKGATTRGGIHLSWKDFKEGYFISDDKYNLGLHEMSHALKLSLLADVSFDKNFGSYIDTWEEIAEKELQRLQRGYPSFLRAYARSNRQEFFAVCVEHFFEASGDFKKMLPDIYNHLVVLLNQDPANYKNDYKMEDGFALWVNQNPSLIPLPQKIKQNFKYSNWHWSLTVLFLGIFGGGFSLLFLYKITVVSTYVFMLLFFCAGAIGMKQRKYFRERQILADELFFIYCFMGFAPLLLSIFLWLNFLVPTGKATREEYLITGYSKEYRQSGGYKFRTSYASSKIEGYQLELENNAYDNTPIVRKVGIDYNDQEKVGFIFQRGLFGIRVLKGYYFPETKE